MSKLHFIRAVMAVFLMTFVVPSLDMSGQVRAQEVPQWSATSQSSSDETSFTTNDSGEVDTDKYLLLEATLNRSKLVILSEPVAKIHMSKSSIAKAVIKDSNSVFIVPTGLGTTNIFLSNQNGNLIKQIEVRVSVDIDGLRSALKQFLPDETIEVAAYRSNIFLSGSVQSAAAADSAVAIAVKYLFSDDEKQQVINLLTITGSQQVIIKVRVSEMDRAIRKNLSVDLTGTYGGTRGLNFTTTSPSTTLTAFLTGSATRTFNGLGNVTFEALERESLIKTLAEPTLTAMSGQLARFHSGGEVLVPTGVNESAVVYEFREFGIGLTFRPEVVGKGMINLFIGAEISEIDPTLTTTAASISVPGFKTKTTETAVSMPSGSSLMISGLLQDSNSNTVNGFPFLKDIPILGALFRSTEYLRDETELVITVTAYLVEPMDGSTPLAIPTDGFEPASDMDIYLLGRLHREYGEGERPFWTDSLRGPFGYIMK